MTLRRRTLAQAAALRAWPLEKQTPVRPKRFSSPSGRRAQQGGGLGGALEATDAVNAILVNPSQVSVCKRGLKGLWSSSPLFANDLSPVSGS